jgi:hypothetical protein
LNNDKERNSYIQNCSDGLVFYKHILANINSSYASIRQSMESIENKKLNSTTSNIVKQVMKNRIQLLLTDAFFSIYVTAKA